jgi:hypothetical protein
LTSDGSRAANPLGFCCAKYTPSARMSASLSVAAIACIVALARIPALK